MEAGLSTLNATIRRRMEIHRLSLDVADVKLSKVAVTPLKLSRDLAQAMIGFNQAFWNPLLRMYGVIPPPKDGKRV